MIQNWFPAPPRSARILLRMDRSSLMIFFTHFLRADKNDNGKRPRAFHEKHSQHLNGISPKTVHIKKLANLTADTKHYGQITLNTDSYLDPLCPLHVTHDVKAPSWARDYDYPKGLKLMPSNYCSTNLPFLIRHFVAK